jgi:glutathione S-transferase
MRLHDNMSSGNGYKVRLLLAQLGVPFERVEPSSPNNTVTTTNGFGLVHP